MKKFNKKLSSAQLLGIVVVVALVLALLVARLDILPDNVPTELELYEKDYATVLAEYDGGKVQKLDIMSNFTSAYNYYYQLYSMFGMSIDNATMNSLVEEATKLAVENRAIAKEFDARGLTLDQTEEELKAQAQTQYDENYAYFLEDAAGDEDAAALAMYQNGLTVETLYNNILTSGRNEKVRESVYAEIAEITEEELQTAYADQLAADEETYTATPTAIENVMSTDGAMSLWMPEGYRTVKHVLVIPEDEVLSAVTTSRTNLKTAQNALAAFENELANLNDDDAAEETEETRTADDIQADIDAKAAEIPALEQAVTDAEAACLASVQTKLDEIYAKLEAGEDINDVMAELGEDPGMQSEPMMSRGYYVAENSTTWDANFTAGAMLLEEVGDYSETPVISTSGVHVIYYSGDVTPGAVALEDVRDELYEMTLENKRAEHYSAKVAEWAEALNPVYHFDRFAF